MITEPIALDKSLNTTDQNPKNLADVVQKGLNDIKNAIGGGGGGGGHTIVDSDGQDMPQEDSMQFADAFLTDDPTNGRTVVENIKEVLPADYDSTTDEGIIVCDDGNDVPIPPVEEDVVSVTADGIKTIATLLNELHALIDMDKVTDNAYIPYADSFFKLEVKTSTDLFLTRSFSVANTIYYGTIQIGNTNSYFHSWELKGNGNVYSNHSTDVPTQGTVISLYYGTSSTVINLKTSADYCMMSDGVTSVEEALTYRIKSATISGTTDNGGNIIVANDIVEIINAHITDISGSARVITPFCGYGYTYLNVKGLDGTNVVGASVTVEYKYLSQD